MNILDNQMDSESQESELSRLNGTDQFDPLQQHDTKIRSNNIYSCILTMIVVVRQFNINVVYMYCHVLQWPINIILNDQCPA